MLLALYRDAPKNTTTTTFAKKREHSDVRCVDRTYTRFIRLKKVMTIAMATPSALLQLSVHMFAQHSVAKSSGIMTWGEGDEDELGLGIGFD